jgi:hypothetical protein
VRYETERKGFWLKTSLSRNRLSRSQDIGCGGDQDVWCGGEDGSVDGVSGGAAAVVEMSMSMLMMVILVVEVLMPSSPGSLAVGGGVVEVDGSCRSLHLQPHGWRRGGWLGWVCPCTR